MLFLPLCRHPAGNLYHRVTGFCVRFACLEEASGFGLALTITDLPLKDKHGLELLFLFNSLCFDAESSWLRLFRPVEEWCWFQMKLPVADHPSLVLSCRWGRPAVWTQASEAADVSSLSCFSLSFFFFFPPLSHLFICSLDCPGRCVLFA